jgi:hypothetical protein
MNKQEKDEIIKFIQEYRKENINLTTDIQVLQFKVDLAKKVDEIFRESQGKIGLPKVDLKKSFMVYEKDFDNYANAQLLVARIQNRRLGSGFVSLQENEARVERLEDPESYSPKKYIRKVKENVVEEYSETRRKKVRTSTSYSRR